MKLLSFLLQMILLVGFVSLSVGSFLDAVQDSLKKLGNLKKEMKESINDLVGMEGSMKVGDRTFDYKIEGDMYGHIYKYLCICTDSESGKAAQAIKKSQTGSLEHCLDKLIDKLEL